MPTGAEKEAAQAARDAARSSIVQGQARLQSEQPRAAGAFPSRRLRSSGDLSRYAIGGFADDPLAPVQQVKGATAKAKTKATAKVKYAPSKLAAPQPKKRYDRPEAKRVGKVANPSPKGRIGTPIVSKGQNRYGPKKAQSRGSRGRSTYC